MKKDGIKIVTIGGGSSYTPELMEGLIKRYHELPVKEIWLVDIKEGLEKLKIIGSLAQRMWDATPYQVKIITTLNRREALEGADFVTTQFRIGLLDARVKDERIPLSHGMMGQETNGAGGMLKAFRTIPVMRDIVKDMKDVCPEAWLINFTNPSGIITEAVIRHFGWKRCIGLCNVPVVAIMSETKLLGKEVDELNYQFAGLNHFHWHRVFDKEGVEVTGQILEHINEENGGTPANIYHAPFCLELLRHEGLLPCGYHRYYYMAADMLAHSLEEFKRNGTRAEQMKEIEKELFNLYRNPELNHKPKELEKRGGAYYSDAACECISAIYNDKKIHMVVSTENRGAVSCLPEDSVAEVSSIISANGAQPLAWGGMRPIQKGMLQLMKAMEECTVEAALTGSYGAALEAFAINPLVQNGTEAEVVLKELLVAHEAHLPQFHEVIKKLKQAGVSSKDPVVMDLMKRGC